MRDEVSRCSRDALGLGLGATCSVVARPRGGLDGLLCDAQEFTQSLALADFKHSCRGNHFFKFRLFRFSHPDIN